MQKRTKKWQQHHFADSDEKAANNKIVDNFLTGFPSNYLLNSDLFDSESTAYKAYNFLVGKYTSYETFQSSGQQKEVQEKKRWKERKCSLCFVCALIIHFYAIFSTLDFFFHDCALNFLLHLSIFVVLCNYSQFEFTSFLPANIRNTQKGVKTQTRLLCAHLVVLLV